MDPWMAAEEVTLVMDPVISLWEQKRIEVQVPAIFICLINIYLLYQNMLSYKNICLIKKEM